MFLSIQNHERNWTVSTIGHITTKGYVLKLGSTKVQTDTKTLFVTYGKPFRAVVFNSMRKWVKDLFRETSILKEHTPHTRRSAAASKTSQLNVDIVETLKQGC